MFRSPPALRSGSKGQRLPLSASSDKPEVQSSLSTSADNRPLNETMAEKFDAASVEKCVKDILLSDVIIDKLADRLVTRMMTAIETAVEKAMAKVNKELDTLRRSMKDMVEQVAEKTDDLEQYQRRNNLRILGLKETRGEDTDKLVVELCRDKLGVALSENSLCRTHRVGKKPDAAVTVEGGKELSRPIIVRFTSYRDRRAIYGMKKKLKGTGITIREDMTTRRVKIWKTAVERFGLRNTWTQDGRVLWVDQEGRRGVATSYRHLGLKDTGHDVTA